VGENMKIKRNLES